VAALVAQMTLDEKAAQMQNHAPAIPRLGIPAYDYWNEGLHGVARSGYATLFPQAIGLAATWDTNLIHQVATTISTEARAKHNQAIAEGNFDIYYGLTIWSPNINIFRDPRWGRGQETYGEDPFLTGRFGVAFVTGLQGDDPQYLRTVSTPKHFAVHSGPESERHRFNVTPSAHDLADTYLPAFRATVTEANAQSIMCAYNAVDGEPACANHQLLGDLLRKDWHFNGFVTSDCWAITDIAEGHKFAPDLEHASVLAVRAGTDTSCGTEFSTLAKAVHDGLIAESELDVSLRRLFKARFDLGMFDPASQVAYARLPFSQVDAEEHRRLALKTARESIVLLKNDDRTLPLAATTKTIAVIGPNAAALAALEGNYNAVPSHPVTPLDGLRHALAGRAQVLYAQGSAYVSELPVPVPESVLRTASGSNEPGLHAEYFSGTDLQDPAFQAKPNTSRTDRQIDFDWNGASPTPAMDAHRFAVRWTGAIVPPAAGDYRFMVSIAHCYPCDDAEGYRVFIDGTQVGQQTIPASASRASTDAPFQVHFADTRPHALRVEYTHSSPRFGAGITLNWFPPEEAMRAEAVHAAEQADAVVAFVGLSPELEGEEMPVKVEGFDGGDRTDIQLPRVQQQLLEAVAKTGKPLIVVLMNGSALAVNWAQQHASAILEAWYPGEEGGTAIADTLLGKNNPAGRLPVTFYRSIAQLPSFDDYSMQGRTYRYSHADPLYRFGDGLSFTHFAYAEAKLSATTLQAGEPLSVAVDVSNAGTTAGDEVVEVYLTSPSSALTPLRSLVGFQRVHLEPGQKRSIDIRIDPRQLSEVDALGTRSVLPGTYHLYIGGHQPSAKEAGLTFAIVGTTSLPR
jgi:beta-glucosidase